MKVGIWSVPLPTGVPPGPTTCRAPGMGVITIEAGVPIAMDLIATPL